MMFLTNRNDITNTNAERRVDDVIGMGSKAHTSYKLKENTTKFGQNTKMYTEEQ